MFQFSFCFWFFVEINISRHEKTVYHPMLVFLLMLANLMLISTVESFSFDERLFRLKSISFGLMQWSRLRFCCIKLVSLTQYFSDIFCREN